MNLPTVIEAPCDTEHPGGDDDMLILKPELLTVCVGEFTFKTFLRNADGETEVTEGLTYTSLSPGVVTIDASTGVATLLAAGVGTISVTDGTLVAAAQVEVVGADWDCCSERTVATMVMIDNSASMASAMTFYPGSRLAFAKATALAVMDGMRLDKDTVGLSQFNLSVTEIQAISSDLPTQATVGSIPQSTLNTDLLDALQKGIAALNAETADRKVLLIFSDGEHRSAPPSSRDWVEIIRTASNFKAAGGIIVCCGCAASGNGFDLLQRIASGGFFFNPSATGYTVSGAGSNQANGAYIPFTETEWSNGLGVVLRQGFSSPIWQIIEGATPLYQADDLAGPWSAVFGGVEPVPTVGAGNAADTLIGLMCYYCGGLPATYGTCLDGVLGAQVPHDPALPEVEF